MKIYIIIIFFLFNIISFAHIEEVSRRRFFYPSKNIVIKIQLMGLTQFRKSFFFVLNHLFNILNQNRAHCLRREASFKYSDSLVSRLRKITK